MRGCLECSLRFSFKLCHIITFFPQNIFLDNILIDYLSLQACLSGVVHKGTPTEDNHLTGIQHEVQRVLGDIFGARGERSTQK